MKWYKFDIENFTDDEYAYWYSYLSKDKKQRVDKLFFAEDKKRTVAGEMLARKAIGEFLCVLPESITFSVNKHGKPYAETKQVGFNISHSENLVVCAVDNDSVGIDVEMIRPVNLSVVKRFCNSEEQLYIFGHKPDKDDFKYTEDEGILNRFFEIWTKKEACSKYEGNAFNPFVSGEDLKIESVRYKNYQITIVYK